MNPEEDEIQSRARPAETKGYEMSITSGVPAICL